jgi:small subunit ribosomal protein S18
MTLAEEREERGYAQEGAGRREEGRPQRGTRWGGRPGGRRGTGGRGARRRRCPFCEQGAVEIDYKQYEELRHFLTERGKIKAQRKNATCAKHQRRLALAIKRARHLALLPFTTEGARG